MLTFYPEDIAENWHMLQNTRAYLNKMMEEAHRLAEVEAAELELVGAHGDPDKE